MKTYIITILCLKFTIIIKLNNIDNLLFDNKLIDSLFKFNYNIKYKLLEPSLKFKPLKSQDYFLHNTNEEYSQLHFMLENIKILELSDKLIQTLIYLIIHYPYIILPISILFIKTIINKMCLFNFNYINGFEFGSGLKALIKNLKFKPKLDFKSNYSFFSKSNKKDLLKKTQPYNRNYIVNMADIDMADIELENIAEINAIEVAIPSSRRVALIGENRIG